jgi:hypothetical protein
MAQTDAITTSSLLAAASDFLERGGYSRISEEPSGQWLTSAVRLYEDKYGIVAIVAFETWSDLSAKWMEAQATLVALISQHLTRNEAKAWDGYLVLLTPNPRPAAATEEASRIDRDTSRVRKLLASGDELKTVSDVESVLLPLLPLTIGGALDDRPESVLEMLPAVLERRSFEKEHIQILIKAFTDHEPLVESLHNRTQQ